jgi:hypothetical protein
LPISVAHFIFLTGAVGVDALPERLTTYNHSLLQADTSEWQTIIRLHCCMPLNDQSASVLAITGGLQILPQTISHVMRTLPGRLASLRRRNSVGKESDECEKEQLSLLQLAKVRRFDLIADVLSNKSDEDVFAWIDDCSLSKDGASGMQTFKGETILHLIMLYQPPVEVVCILIQRMMQKRPDTVPEAATDLLSRTPLHIAVMNDCEVAVIERLLSGTVTLVPAVAKDSQQRLPLHWACIRPKSKDYWWQSCAARLRDSENTIRVIETLLDAYPHAVHVQDQTGMTPLDLAIVNFSHPYVLRLLDDLTMSKSPTAIDHSNSETVDTLQSDIPYEISNSSNDDEHGHDEDDVSSIGTGGISSYHWNGRRKPSRGSPLEHIPEQCQI